MRHPLKNNKGFTLVEMIAVLIILSIMFAIAIPRYVSFDSNADQQSEAYMDKSVERKAVVEYYELETKGNLDEFIKQRQDEEREKRNNASTIN